ncbi:membrane hypothetical protein [Paraburkholderia piptadeniae]|uniref:Uncharacterized protein n=1 Tax=Paraburkholderia piptadeniae TaxID=1701573 RepID=A0A1N7SRW9_9BURK|nr:membrane hypothetical protein [Paraburkholderia piptadeniae]
MGTFKTQKMARNRAMSSSAMFQLLKVRANRVLIAVAIVVAALKITNTPYRPFSDGAQFIHFLYGCTSFAAAAAVGQALARHAIAPQRSGGRLAHCRALISTGVFGVVTARWVLDGVRSERSRRAAAHYPRTERLPCHYCERGGEEATRRASMRCGFPTRTFVSQFDGRRPSLEIVRA